MGKPGPYRSFLLHCKISTFLLILVFSGISNSADFCFVSLDHPYVVLLLLGVFSVAKQFIPILCEVTEMLLLMLLSFGTVTKVSVALGRTAEHSWMAAASALGCPGGRADKALASALIMLKGAAEGDTGNRWGFGESQGMRPARNIRGQLTGPRGVLEGQTQREAVILQL